jgi:hypothetical protein
VPSPVRSSGLGEPILEPETGAGQDSDTLLSRVAAYCVNIGPNGSLSSWRTGADTSHMADLQIDSNILAGLELARDQLAALIERSERCRVGAHPGLPEFGPRCECGKGLSDETIKDAIRPFMATWALFPFDTALAAIRGQAHEGERAYLEAVAKGTATTGAAPANSAKAKRSARRRRAVPVAA